MKTYRIIIPENLDVKMKKMGFNQDKRFEKLKLKLATNPYAGKRLGRNLFEKKWGPFRIYYIIIEDIAIVVLIDYAHKKEQRTTINQILINWDLLEDELRKRYQ